MDENPIDLGAAVDSLASGLSFAAVARRLYDRDAAFLMRHMHRFERAGGGARALACAFAEAPAVDDATRAKALALLAAAPASFTPRLVADDVSAAVVATFDVAASATALSLLPDGRLVVGRHEASGVVIDLATRAQTLLGPAGYREKRGHTRALASPPAAPASTAPHRPIAAASTTSQGPATAAMKAPKKKAGAKASSSKGPSSKASASKAAKAKAASSKAATVAVAKVAKAAPAAKKAAPASLHGAAVVDVDKCAYAFLDDTGKELEMRKSGFEKAYTFLHAVSVSDGAIAVGCPDGVVRLHDVATGKNANLKGHSKGRAVNRIAFSADGTRLASGAFVDPAASVIVWDVASKKALHTIVDGRAGGEIGFAGYTLAIHMYTDTGSAFLLVDAAGNKREIPAPDDVRCVTGTADAVLCGTGAGVLHVVALDGTLRGRVHLGGTLQDILVLDDPKDAHCRVAVAADDGAVHILKLHAIDVEPPRLTRARQAVASADGARVVARSESPLAAEVIARPSGGGRAPREHIPGNIEVATISRDGSRRAWAHNGQIVVDGNVVVANTGNVHALAFSPDATRLAAIAHRTIYVIEVGAGKLEASATVMVRPTEVFWNNPTSIVWHPTQPWVVGVSRPGTSIAVDVWSGEIANQAASKTHGDFPAMHQCGDRYAGPHNSNHLRRDIGNRAFLVVNDRTTGAFTTLPANLVPYQPVPEGAPTHQGDISAFCFLPSKNLIVTGGLDGTVRAFTDDGAPVARYDAAGPIGALAAADDAVVAVLSSGTALWLSLDR